MVEGNELNPGDEVEFDELGEFGGSVFETGFVWAPGVEEPNDTWCWPRP